MPEDYLIPPSGDEPDVGKTAEALRKSRGCINDLIALFGRDFIPSSIMVAKRVAADERLDALAAERSYANSLPDYNKRGLHDPKATNATKSMHRMNSGSLTGALSKFPQGVGRAVVLFYSEPGDHVVDPFAGHNSRMELCVRAGRDYTGCDLSTEFMKFNRAKADELRSEFKNRRIEVHHTDSRRQPIPDEVGDMTITSPPYWDIEYYGDEPEQMANCRTYRDFMLSMKEVLAENYRTLKPGAFSCWFINDFRRKGVFYPYHADIGRAGEKVGFIWHDIIIVDLGKGLRDGFINENFRLKMIPKRHEYCVVLRKPPRDE